MLAKTLHSQLYHCRLPSSALSTDKCCPFPGSAGVRLSFFNGEPIVCGDVVPDFGGVSNGIGVMVPLGGTGILMSSGDAGIISSGSPEMVILDASLL